jgi:hypothetical protein
MKKPAPEHKPETALRTVAEVAVMLDCLSIDGDPNGSFRQLASNLPKNRPA